MLRKWFWLFNLIAALIVRFLTKRYIGEYDHQTENRYKHEAMVSKKPSRTGVSSAKIDVFIL